MKKLTCQDLGGPCDEEFIGNTFEEIGQQSHAHVMQEIEKGDDAHIAAANKMKEASPEERQEMMGAFKKRFDEAEEV